MKTFVIQNKEVLARLTAYIKAQPAKPILEVAVKEHHKDRTLSQNSTLWMWNTDIANEWGWTKKEVHKHYKKEILVHIYERDDSGYRAMIQSVRDVHKAGLVQQAKALADQIVDMTSTTDASVKQFAEYLTEIERDCISKGIPLRHPEDYHYALMIHKPAA
ncbi:MAG: hypothetical protein HOC09_35265 [Deltaproteobacteria bacterium]|jgi:hypothetical protein|nr:hypothetical protein [Deltaproteobacteria bacterium]